jgi:hypothetical protein
VDKASTYTGQHNRERITNVHGSSGIQTQDPKIVHAVDHMAGHLDRLTST